MTKEDLVRTCHMATCGLLGNDSWNIESSLALVVYFVTYPEINDPKAYLTWSNAILLNRGWKLGPRTDHIKKESPYIVNWNELPILLQQIYRLHYCIVETFRWEIK